MGENSPRCLRPTSVAAKGEPGQPREVAGCLTEPITQNRPGPYDLCASPHRLDDAADPTSESRTGRPSREIRRPATYKCVRPLLEVARDVLALDIGQDLALVHLLNSAIQLRTRRELAAALTAGGSHCQPPRLLREGLTCITVNALVTV
jgi:hypothetical protein